VLVLVLPPPNRPPPEEVDGGLMVMAGTAGPAVPAGFGANRDDGPALEAAVKRGVGG